MIFRSGYRAFFRRETHVYRIKRRRERGLFTILETILVSAAAWLLINGEPIAYRFFLRPQSRLYTHDLLSRRSHYLTITLPDLPTRRP
jgi:hypothetical protein